jgi:hypothetical protein
MTKYVVSKTKVNVPTWKVMERKEEEMELSENGKFGFGEVNL